MQEKKRAIVMGCILGLILLASIVSYIVLQWTADNGSPRYVRMMQNGQCIKKIDLSEVSEAYRITIENKSGGYNVVEIRPDSVGIVEADCPDKLCQKQGFIDNGSEVIVCLPNRLVIEFEDGKSSDEEYDVVIQ